MAKTTRVVMPQLGESVHEGTISKWLGKGGGTGGGEKATISKWRVKEGDKAVASEPMLEVDTDKVNAEVPAPVTGILREILAKEGETVQAGAEIAVVEIAASPPGGEVPPGASSPPSGELPRGARSAPRGGGDVETGRTGSVATKAETPPVGSEASKAETLPV